MFKVGDKVRSDYYGRGVVEEIVNELNIYPIFVVFEEGYRINYTVNGVFSNSFPDISKNITLLEPEKIDYSKAAYPAIDKARYFMIGHITASGNIGCIDFKCCDGLFIRKQITEEIQRIKSTTDTIILTSVFELTREEFEANL